MEVESRNIKNFNNDLKLMRNLAATSPQQDWPRPKDIRQLQILLSNKNPRDLQYQQTLEKGKQWLLKKGIDLQPLMTRLRRAQQLNTDFKQSQRQLDNYFHVNLNKQNLDQYLLKSNQYSSMNLIQYIMNRGNTRHRFIGRAISALRDQPVSQFKVSWECERVPERRETYLRIVKGLVFQQKDHQKLLKELLFDFKTQSWDYKEQIIWKILATQLQSYNENIDENQNKTNLLISSLRLIQKQFQRKIQVQDLDRYIHTRYLNKIEGKLLNDKNIVWAKVFVYMSAGLHKQAIELVSFSYKNYNDFITAYQKALQSIGLGRPLGNLIKARPDIKDVFYEQILYCLNGQSKYSHTVMGQQFSLELIWILLRSTGIFWNQSQYKFQKLRSNIIGGYKNCTSNPQAIKNMLYLLDYDTIVGLGANSILTKDDYLHFLLVISAYPTLINQKMVQDKLVQKTIEFILELMLEKREEYVYYIALIPQHRIVAAVSQAIVSSDMITNLNWKRLKELLRAEVYRDLVKVSLARFVNVRGDYFKAALKVSQLLDDSETALEYLTKLFIRHYLHKQVLGQDVLRKAEQAGAEFCRHINVNPAYEQLLKLFESLGQLNNQLVRRDGNSLQQIIVRNNQFIIVTNKPLFVNLEMLSKLQELKGIEIYFIYLKGIAKAAEISYLQINRVQDLLKFKRVLKDSLNHLFELEPLSKWKNQPIAYELMESLRENY